MLGHNSCNNVSTGKVTTKRSRKMIRRPLYPESIFYLLFITKYYSKAFSLKGRIEIGAITSVEKGIFTLNFCSLHICWGTCIFLFIILILISVYCFLMIQYIIYYKILYLFLICVILTCVD